MGKEKDETVYADKTKVIISGTSTVADIEARMKVVLERDVIPTVKKWDQYKKDNPNWKNEGPRTNTPKAFDDEIT